MTEREERIRIGRAFDKGLSGLQGDPSMARRVWMEAEKRHAAGGKRRLTAVLIALLALLLTAAGAYALSRALLSPRVDAKRIANEALEEKYGLTPAMLGFFSQDAQGNDGRSWRVSYTRSDELEEKLGSYLVRVTDGKVESAVWSLEGKSTAGGFDAEAWGARQLGEMVRITAATHDMSRFYSRLRGTDVDLYAGMDGMRETQEPEGTAETDAEIRAEAERERQALEEAGRESEARSRFTREELIELGRQGVAAAYGLTPAQQQRMRFEDTPFFPAYFSPNGLDGHPAFHMTFQVGYEDGWQEGDGIYTVVINALDGTVEYLDYDTTLDGNG